MNRTDKILNKNGKIVADSSTIIYLEKIGMLKKYAAFKKLLVPKPILNELIQKKTETNYRKLTEILWYDTTDTMAAKFLPLTYPDCLLIDGYHRTRADGILTDDGKICKYCKKKEIPYLNTPMCLFSLVVNQIIDRQEYRNKLREVYKIGRYSKAIEKFIEDITERYIDNV